MGYPGELFDLATDPGEERDLASDPKFYATVSEFEERLRGILDLEAIDARAKADQAALIARFGARRRP